MEVTATISKLLLETGQSLISLQQRLQSDEEFQVLARQLGWDIPTLPAPLTNLLPQLGQLDAAVRAVIDEASLSNLAALKTSVTTVAAAIKNLANATYTLPSPFDATAFRAEFPEQLLNVLLVEYLQTHHSQIYGLLYGASLITREYVPASGQRLAYIRVGINLHLLANLLQDPTSFWRTVYGWGGTFAYDRLVMSIGELLDRLGVPTGYLAADYDLLTTLSSDPIPVSGALPVINALQISLLHEITSLGELYMGIQLLPVLNSTGTPQGVAIAAQALGGLNKSIELGNNFSLSLVGEAGLEGGIGLALRPMQPLQVKSLASASATLSGKFEATIQHLPTEVAGAQQLLLRTPGNTELTYENITWSLGASATNNDTDFYTGFKVNALRFASGSGDNDSFLNHVLQNFSFKTDLTIGLSKNKGFYFDSNGSLDTQQVKNVVIGPVELSKVGIAVKTINDFTYLTVVSDIQVKIGPVQAHIVGLGIKAGIKYSSTDGDIGPFSLDINAKAPTGVGIAVDSDVIKGRGYLSIDPANHRYTGIANLTFRDKLTLNAVGILQTELPNQQDGYSLLLLITAQFAPVQLGLGFTLNGVGGLVGVNRTLNIPYLREQVRAGRINRLLFPANVLDNPTEALSTIESSFPAAEGRYVFGLMAKIGWGAPTLITLDAALILELPSPVRLALLGVLQAILPDKDRQIVKLRADFLGTVDFGAKKVAFDATLTDSRILQFALTGDAAFRLYNGNNPVFLLTSGGFHPAFQPPTNADLPTLRRLRLALSDNNDLRIILTSYLAITSNTVQFGSRLDVYVDLPFSFYLEGFMGFDVLFQFHPFRVAAYVGASVAIKRKGSTKLGIYLSLNVTGPAPWHVVGEASFRVLGFKIKARIDRTFGSGAVAQPLLPVNVRNLFVDALNEAGNWEVEQPTGSTRSATMLRATPQNSAHLLIDPSGALVFRQKLVPLQYTLEKFSNSSVIGGNQFDVTRVTQTGTTPVDLSLEPVTDFFAPEQFRRMSDAQKLSSPSFQLMRSGYRLRGLDGFDGGTPIQKIVDYEQIIVSRADAEAGSANLVAANTVAPAPVVAAVAPKRFTPTAAQFRQLAKNSRINRSYEDQAPSARAAAPVRWSEDQYVVVSAQDLSVYGQSTSFLNEAEATAYLQAQVAQGAVRADELLVVPAYELELV